jgi:hypothetical protein
VESLEDEILKLSSGDPEALEVWAFVSNGEPVDRRIEELRQRIEWRKMRRNPPRCLECGAFDAVAIPMGGEFRHPETGELVKELSSGFADTEAWIAEFTPEGDRIAEPSHPADRKPPG